MSLDEHDLAAKRVLSRLEAKQDIVFVSSRGASALAGAAAHFLLRCESESTRASAFAEWLIDQVEVADLFVEDEVLEALLVSEWDGDASPRPAIVARHEQLEAQLLARPDDLEAHQVYGDWLQSQGDPHGELIVRHVAVKQTDDAQLAAQRTRHAQDYYELHADELLGPLAPYLGSVVSLRWRLGFVRRARLVRDADYGENYDGAQLMRWLLEQRACLLLRALEFESLTLAPSQQLGEMLAELARRPPPLLERLHIGDGNGGEIEPLFAALPGLRSLVLPSNVLRTSPLDFPQLRSLTVNVVWPENLSPLWRTSLPELEQLALRGRDLEVDDAGPLFDATAYPKLRALQLRGSWDVLERLCTSKLLAQLEILDLSDGTLDQVAIEQLLLRNLPRFCGLRRLVLSRNELSAAAADWVVGALGSVEVEIGEQDPPDDDEHYEDAME